MGRKVEGPGPCWSYLLMGSNGARASIMSPDLARFALVE